MFFQDFSSSYVFSSYVFGFRPMFFVQDLSLSYVFRPMFSQKPEAMAGYPKRLQSLLTSNRLYNIMCEPRSPWYFITEAQNVQWW